MNVDEKLRRRNLILKRLALSFRPKKLIGLDNEEKCVMNFLQQGLETRKGASMYMSGIPGIGKTALAHVVGQELQERCAKKRSATSKKSAAPFVYVQLNCNGFLAPADFYAKFYFSLTSQQVTNARAEDLLAGLLDGATAPPIILVLDEIDLLLNKRNDVIYNIFDWPIRMQRTLLVLAISNNLKLPETAFGMKICSRLDSKTLYFKNYDREANYMIIRDRVGDGNADIITDEALKLISAKVSSFGTDVRRTLSLTAKLLAEFDGVHPLTREEAIKTYNNIFPTRPECKLLSSLSQFEKHFIHSLGVLTANYGYMSDEVNLEAVQVHLTISKVAFLVSSSLIHQVALKLAEMRIVKLQQSAGWLDAKTKVFFSDPEDHIAALHFLKADESFVGKPPEDL